MNHLEKTLQILRQSLRNKKLYVRINISFSKRQQEKQKFTHMYLLA